MTSNQTTDHPDPIDAKKPTYTRTTYIETSEDLETNSKTYKVVVSASDYTLAKLTPLDYALLDDIDNGPLSSTPLADKLLGLEMIVRRIEESSNRLAQLNQEEGKS